MIMQIRRLSVHECFLQRPLLLSLLEANDRDVEWSLAYGWTKQSCLMGLKDQAHINIGNIRLRRTLLKPLEGRDGSTPMTHSEWVLNRLIPKPFWRYARARHAQGRIF